MLEPISVKHPVRIQLSRAKGWRKPPNTISVARPSLWGNPWRVGVDGDAKHCVEEFRKALLGDEPVSAWPKDGSMPDLADESYVRYVLRGHNLACWCKLGEPCHADVLLEIANK